MFTAVEEKEEVKLGLFDVHYHVTGLYRLKHDWTSTP